MKIIRYKAAPVLALILFSMLTFLATRPAAAMYVSTGELSRMCMSDDKADIHGCVNYVAGVIDYHIVMQSLGTVPTIDFCLPNDITKPQAAVIVTAYLRQQPQHAGFVAAASVPLALNKAFPCRQPVPKAKGK